MTRKKSRIRILQFNEQSISALRVKPASAYLEVESYYRETGPWSGPEGTLREALRDFVRQHKVAEDRVYSIIERHDVTVRVIDLPSQDPDEVAGMVRLGAEELVPYPLNELVISQSILAKLPDGSAKVLVAIAHRDVVQSHIETLRNAGIEPTQIYLSTACLVSASLAGEYAAAGCIALLHLTGAGLEVVCLRDGTPEYGRGVNLPDAWNANATPEAFDEIVSEVRASLSAYRRESADERGAETIYVSSDGTGVREIADALDRQTQFECLPATQGLDCVRTGKSELSGLPLVAVGGALTALGLARHRIELLPEEIVQSRGMTALRRKTLRIAAMATLVLALLGATYFQGVSQRLSYIRELEGRIDEIRPRVENVMTKQKHLRRLQEQVEQRETPLELLAALSELAPRSGLNFARFSYKYREGIELRGRATERSYVHALTDALRESGIPQFARAQEIYTEYNTERSREVWDFGVSIKFQDEEEDGR